MFQKSVILSYFLIFSLVGFSQIKAKKEKVPSYFGLQFKPLIPGDFLGKSKTTIRNGNFSALYKQQLGYSFGGSVRVGITELISIESGINLIQRNYSIDYSYPDSSLSLTSGFGITNYDIPINALIYIKLSDVFYMNASLGGSVVFNPSNVAKIEYPGGLNQFKHEGRRHGKMGFEFNANIGFELRTEKSGFFYLGASGRIPTQSIYNIAAIYSNTSSSTKLVATGGLDGAYLAIDIRYYFPNIKNKGVQFKPGPIEQ